MPKLLKFFFTVGGVGLLLGAFVTDRLTSFGERFRFGFFGFLILSICYPSATVNCFKWLWRAIVSVIDWICKDSQEARQEPNWDLKLDTKPKTKPTMTIETLNEKHSVNEITTEQEYREFLASHICWKSFIAKVVGVTYPNDDGTDRQEILSQCLCGESVAFYWHEFCGAPACAVITDYGQIGYLRAELAAELNMEYGGDEYIIEAHISDITGGFDGLSYGCNLMISIYRITQEEITQEIPATPEILKRTPQASPVTPKETVLKKNCNSSIAKPISRGLPIDDNECENEAREDTPPDMFSHIRDPKVMAHYIALDIETTGFNREKDKIIEIAAIHYVFDTEVERFHTYINPGIPIPEHITELTGIRQSDVDGAPLIDDIKNSFHRFINNYPIVGHNLVAFDWPFLKENIIINEPCLLIDTLEMAKKVFPELPSHKLSDLNYWFDLNDGLSHRADADASAANALMWACLYPDRYELQYKAAIQFGVPKTQNARAPAKNNSFEKVRITDIKPTSEPPVHPGPLYGKKIVFTGELSITRNEAMQMAVNAGALLRTGVSHKTDYLVIGKQDLSVVGDDGMSVKEEKAHELNKSGKGCVQIINESEFMNLIKAVPELDTKTEQSKGLTG